MFKSILAWAAGILFRAAMDKALGTAISKAISVAEESGLTGGEKMDLALQNVRDSGVKALANETTSTLRTKIEQALDRL